MGFLKENYKQLILLVIVLMAMLYVGSFFQKENVYISMRELRKQEKYSGIVVKKYIDYSQHSTPKLQLTDTLISMENTFWDRIEIGDSIVKNRNDLYIKVYSANEVKVFDYNEYFKKLIRLAD